MQAALVEQVAKLVDDGKIGGISDIRDESDRSGTRVVIEIKRGKFPVFDKLHSKWSNGPIVFLYIHMVRTLKTAAFIAGSSPQLTMNQLVKYTTIQTRFSCNMIGLVNGLPKTLTLKDFLNIFLDFRFVYISKMTYLLYRKPLFHCLKAGVADAK